jgi:hypothetical protein
MYAEMIVLEHRRRAYLRRKRPEKAAEIAEEIRRKTEEFRRERAEAVGELRQKLDVALKEGNFVEAVKIANRINELEK